MRIWEPPYVYRLVAVLAIVASALDGLFVARRAGADGAGIAFAMIASVLWSVACSLAWGMLAWNLIKVARPRVFPAKLVLTSFFCMIPLMAAYREAVVLADWSRVPETGPVLFRVALSGGFGLLAAFLVTREMNLRGDGHVYLWKQILKRFAPGGTRS